MAGISREDLVSFQESWIKPNASTLVVVGDVTMDEILPMLEDRFADWKSGALTQKNIATIPQKERATVYIMDQPGAQQSIILAAQLIPPKNDPSEFAIQTMNTIIGGAFTARINMNLREDKGWSYGAESFVLDARGQRPFIIYAQVQTDKTSESMSEILRELHEFLNERPATDEEVLKAQQSQTLTLAGQWETNNAVETSIQNLVQFGFDDTYYDTYADRIRALSVLQVREAANRVLQPDRLVWIVVGDRSVIESKIRDLNLGEIQFLDGDGNLVK